MQHLDNSNLHNLSMLAESKSWINEEDTVGTLQRIQDYSHKRLQV